MEIMLKMNFAMGKRVSLFTKQRSSSMNKHSMKNFVVSCRMKEFSSIQKGNNNYYQLLSLSSKENVGFEEIKKAYRSKALQFHPDVCPSSMIKEECTKQFVELRKAYEVLSDPDSRRAYDFELSLLGDSFGGSYGFRGLGRVEGQGSFRKEVWEGQLSRLGKRSLDRMEKKKNNKKSKNKKGKI